MAIKINFKKTNSFCTENVCYLVPVQSPFQFSHKSWSPPTDICITDNNIFIISAIPGVDLNDITITYMNNSLIINGFRKFPLSEDENIFYQKEIGYGEFEKKLRLPFPIDTDTIEATLRSGMLIIKAKKIHKKESVKINIS